MASKEYYQANKELIKAKGSEYYQANKERIKARARKYYYANRDEISAQKREHAKDYYQKPEVKLKHAEQKRKYWADPIYRAKHAARRKLFWALRKGLIFKLPCEVCGNKDTHGHHDDHTKPLEVRWLCSVHHHELHRQSSPFS